MSSFKLDTSNPSSKFKVLLNVVGSHFESLEKAANIEVFNQFNAIKLKQFLKMIEYDRVSLVTSLKIIWDAIDEGGNIYKSCLIFPKFTIDIDKKIRECESQLASIS